MNSFALYFTEFWPILTAICTMIFIMGITYQKVQASLAGVKKLFEIVDDIKGFREAQVVHNLNQKEAAKILADQLIEQNKETIRKHAELMVRVDAIYQLLIKSGVKS